MNKIILIVCVAVAVLAANIGFSLRSKVDEIEKQNNDLTVLNNHMTVEIGKKESLAKKDPMDLSKEFSIVINETRYLEGYSGTTMTLSIEKSKDSDDISNYYVDSEYRGIKKLPVTIQVDKFSNETDMAAVLNDIYQLEAETDFKVSEINMDGNSLIVKGDVYGI